jgi:hypothetical protein
VTCIEKLNECSDCRQNGRGNAYSVSVEKLEIKKPLGCPRCRWKDNIKIDAKEVVYENVD